MFQKNIPIHQLESLNILAIEKMEQCDTLKFEGLHRHNFYEILFFTEISENDTHSIDFVEYPLSIHTFYILKPGQAYKLNYNHQKGFLIAISPDFFTSSDFKLFTSEIFPNVITYNDDKEEMNLAIRLIELMYYEYMHKKRERLLYSFLNSLILILEISGKHLYYKGEYDERIYLLFNLIEDSYKTSQNVDFYAHQLGVSQKTLNRLCTKYIGQTIKQIIQERIFLEAQRKIVSDELSFQEIAYELGFKEASYFTRFFKIKSGKTPEEFRNSFHRDND